MKDIFYKRSDSSNAKIVDDLKNKFLSVVEFANEKHWNNIKGALSDLFISYLSAIY